jgi:hypothetical protein
MTHLVQSWAEDTRQVLNQAHNAVREAIAASHNALDPELLTGLRERYDSAVAWGRPPTGCVTGTTARTTPATSWPAARRPCWPALPLSRGGIARDALC